MRVVALRSHGEELAPHGEPADFEADTAALVDAVEAAHAEEPFDVLHAQYGYPPGLAALLASQRTGVPNLVSVQGGDGHWVGTCCATHKEAITRVLRSAGAVLIGSRSFADEVTGHHGTPPERFTVVPGATDTVRFAPRAGRPLGALADPPTLLFHGRVDARKGVLDLLDALALLPPEVRLQVSGIGPDSARAAERVTRLGLADRVELLGYTSYEDAPAVYAGADVFVSPTYSEGFSNTILEAMAAGLPVVSTRSVGVVDCLRDGENGLLTEPGDVPGLAAALTRLLADAALRARLASTALDEVRSTYAWPVLARTVLDAYASLVGTAPDTGWKLSAPVDLTCRFRAAPHLL